MKMQDIKCLVVFEDILFFVIIIADLVSFFFEVRDLFLTASPDNC